MIVPYFGVWKIHEQSLSDLSKVLSVNDQVGIPAQLCWFLGSYHHAVLPRWHIHSIPATELWWEGRPPSWEQFCPQTSMKSYPHPQAESSPFSDALPLCSPLCSVMNHALCVASCSTRCKIYTAEQKTSLIVVTDTPEDLPSGKWDRKRFGGEVRVKAKGKCEVHLIRTYRKL